VQFDTYDMDSGDTNAHKSIKINDEYN